MIKLRSILGYFLVMSLLTSSSIFCSEKSEDLDATAENEDSGLVISVGKRTLWGIPLGITFSSLAIGAVKLAYDYLKPANPIVITNSCSPELNVGYRTLIGVPLACSAILGTYFGIRLGYNYLNKKFGLQSKK